MGACKTKVIQRDLQIFTHRLVYSGLFTYVLVYSGIFSHFSTLSVIFRNYPRIFRHIQKLLSRRYIRKFGTFETLVYPKFWYIQNTNIIRTLVNSEPWYIQNPSIFRTRTIFRTLVYSGPQASLKFTTLWNICDRTLYENMQILVSAIFKYGQLQP